MMRGPVVKLPPRGEVKGASTAHESSGITIAAAFRGWSWGTRGTGAVDLPRSGKAKWVTFRIASQVSNRSRNFAEGSFVESAARIPDVPRTVRAPTDQDGGVFVPLPHLALGIPRVARRHSIRETRIPVGHRLAHPQVIAGDSLQSLANGVRFHFPWSGALDEFTASALQRLPCA